MRSSPAYFAIIKNVTHKSRHLYLLIFVKANSIFASVSVQSHCILPSCKSPSHLIAQSHCDCTWGANDDDLTQTNLLLQSDSFNWVDYKHPDWNDPSGLRDTEQKEEEGVDGGKDFLRHSITSQWAHRIWLFGGMSRGICVCVWVCTRDSTVLGGVLGDGVWGDQAFGEV